MCEYIEAFNEANLCLQKITSLEKEKVNKERMVSGLRGSQIGLIENLFAIISPIIGLRKKLIESQKKSFSSLPIHFHLTQVINSLIENFFNTLRKNPLILNEISFGTSCSCCDQQSIIFYSIWNRQKNY